MDLQMVGSVYGAAQYVCHYMCKDKPKELRQLISRHLEKLPGNCTQKSGLLKIGNTLISHRILSAQEAVYRTTGLHLRGSSRGTIFVNTGRPQKRTRVIKSTRKLREMDGGDTDVFESGLYERYAARPFDNMSLAHFAVWYATSKAPSTLSMSSRAQPRYELQGNSGWIYLRRKQACLRLPTLTPEANGDDYYYHLLMLYLPWCNETVDLLGSHATAKQSFVSNNDRLLVLGGDQASFAAEAERATCQLRVLNQFGDTPIAPGAAQRNMEMENEGAGPDPIYYDEALLAATYDYLADADDDRTVRAMGQRRMTDAEYRRKVDSLNESQRLAFQKVLNYTTARHEYQMHAVESPPEPLRLFITSGAGTGKSHVISVVHEHFETNLYSRKVMVIILVLPTCGEISSQWWS